MRVREVREFVAEVVLSNTDSRVLSVHADLERQVVTAINVPLVLPRVDLYKIEDIVNAFNAVYARLKNGRVAA